MPYITFTAKTAAELAQYIPDKLEIVLVTDTGRLSTGDGETVGGRMSALLSDITGGPPGGQVATPTFSPSSGTSFATSLSVSISCATEDASIYYTTNGTTPTESSTLYTGPITVAATTTVKAIATKSGMTTSNVGSALYSLRFTLRWGVSSSATLDAAGIAGLSGTASSTTAAGDYAFVPSGEQYWFFAWPNGMTWQPRATDGFEAEGFPLAGDMAEAADGFTESENGWNFSLVTVSGVVHRLYRLKNTQSGAGTITVNV